MFELHTAYSLQLLVLGVGLTLIYFGRKQVSQLLKTGGYLLTGLTLLNMLCTLYYGIRYWEDGYFRSPYTQTGMTMPMMGPGMNPMMGSGMGGMGMMGSGKMGMDCPMMKEMMQKGVENKGATGQEKAPGNINPASPSVSPEDHEAHH